MRVIIHTDGGALNNPGPAAIGVVIEIDPSTKTQGKPQIKKYAKKIGWTTNNVAEYRAVIFALEQIKKILKPKIKPITITLVLDSELVGKQLRGQYRVKDSKMKVLYEKVQALRADLPPLTIKIVRRELNIEADALVKSVLYKKQS